MSNRGILVIILLTVLATIVVFFVINKKTLPLISPIFKPGINAKSSLPPSPVLSIAPSTPSYNPPEELHYGSATDLKQELDTINPQVLDSDFQGL